MPSSLARELDAALHDLMFCRGQRKIPNETMLRRARVVLNRAEDLQEPIEDRLEGQLDLLYGFFIQGRMLLPAFSLRPDLLGQERAVRRAERARSAATASRARPK